MNEKEVKNKSSRTSKTLKIVFSVICAVLLWVYVTDTQGEDITVPFTGVKVVFEGENTMRESRGLIVSDAEINSAKVTVTGNRRTVSALNAADLSVVVDLSGISKTGTYSIAPKVTYPAKTDTGAIAQAVTSPGTVSFYVDKLSSKPVQVMGVFNGSAAEGYTAEPLDFDTETVKIYGPEKVLAHVDHALVEVSREDVDKTLSFESNYILIDEDGKEFRSDEITFERDTVNVTLPIRAVKEVSLVVDLIYGAGATEDNVKWKIEPGTITLTGDSETLAGVNSISLDKIDLAAVDEALTETYKIVIPNDTEVTGGEKEATLTLEIGGLYKREVSIDSSYISCINCSEGYSAQVMSGLDGVILRGPEDTVKHLSEVNIRAVADLKDFGTATGIVSVPVSIVIDGTTTVGAVTTEAYKVYVNITKD